MKPFILGAVFARGGSKSIPRKNIQLLGGKPLLAYAIETARRISLIDDVIVSTDNKEIAEVAKQYGAEVPFLRPAELATDEAPMLLAQQHAVREYERLTKQKVDVLVSIPTTSPLREDQDVQNCIAMLLDSDVDCVLTVTPAHRNPYFNMVTLDDQQRARLVIQPKVSVARRQDAPSVYDVTTVAYAISTAYLQKNKPLIEGNVKAVIVPPERALDIDTPLDWEIADFLISKKIKAL